MKEAARLDIFGSAKKRHVEEKLAHVKGKALKVYKETSNTMINLAIEAAVVWMKGKARQ